MSYTEKILEGKYNYLNAGQIYSEETFLLLTESKKQGNYIFKSEVLSRVRTGEFLKVYVEYEVTHQFDPIRVNIKRLLGDKSSVEEYYIDQKTKNIIYDFTDTNGKVFSSNRFVPGKTHIGTPCFFTSMLSINSKPLDPVHRASYQLITSNNIWEYEDTFMEKEFFLELQNIEAVNIQIGGKDLKASYCKLHETNTKHIDQSVAHDIYLSKHFYVPYKAIFSDTLEIEVESMKRYNDEFSRR